MIVIIVNFACEKGLFLIKKTALFTRFSLPNGLFFRSIYELSANFRADSSSFATDSFEQLSV